jgi:hypothetical protein
MGGGKGGWVAVHQAVRKRRGDSIRPQSLPFRCGEWVTIIDRRAWGITDASPCRTDGTTRERRNGKRENGVRDDCYSNSHPTFRDERHIPPHGAIISATPCQGFVVNRAITPHIEPVITGDSDGSRRWRRVVRRNLRWGGGYKLRPIPPTDPPTSNNTKPHSCGGHAPPPAGRRGTPAETPPSPRPVRAEPQ